MQYLREIHQSRGPNFCSKVASIRNKDGVELASVTTISKVVIRFPALFSTGIT